MKVLQINSVCGIRSTGRICTDLADVLMKHGHECRIAYGREDVPEKYKPIAYRIGSETDVRLHVLRTRLFDSAGFGSRRATEKLVGYIGEYAPDIIHLHNIHGYYLNIEVLFDYLSNADVPVVWTLHDCWAFTGHCACFDYVGCCRWKTGCCDCPQKREYPASYFLDRSKRNLQRKRELFTGVKNMTIITPSEWLASLAGESFLGRYPIHVIRNGIDLEAFKPINSGFAEKYGLGDKKIVLGVASTWSERKGLRDFDRLSEILSKDKYKIVLVGADDAQKKSISPDILCIGRTNSVSELAGIYTAADVYVNATYEDNFPTTNIEALACGTPVVTYNTGGSPESLAERCGRVVDKGDVCALARQVEEICGADVLTEKECRTRAAAFDKKKCFEKYVGLYI